MAFKEPQVPTFKKLASDINVLLVDVGIKVTPNELKKPTRDLVQPIYHHLVTIISGIKTINLNPAEWTFNSLISDVEAIELYYDLSRDMILNRLVSRMLQDLSCDMNFMLADLLSPDAERTRQFMSALIEFIRSIYKCQDPIRKYRDQAEEKQWACGRQREEREMLMDKVNLAKETISKQEIHAEAYKAEITKKKKHLKQAMDDNSALDAEKAEIKKKISSKEKMKNELDLYENDLQAKKADIEREIVESPEKLLAELEVKKSKLSQQRKIVNSKRERADGFPKLDSMNEELEEFAKLIKIVDFLEKTQKEYKDNVSEWEVLQKEIAQKHTELTLVLKEQNDNQKEYDELQETVKEKEHKNKLKVESLKSDIDDLTVALQKRKKIVDEKERLMNLLKKKVADNKKLIEMKEEEIQLQEQRMNQKFKDKYKEYETNKLVMKTVGNIVEHMLKRSKKE